MNNYWNLNVHQRCSKARLYKSMQTHIKTVSFKQNIVEQGVKITLWQHYLQPWLTTDHSCSNAECLQFPLSCTVSKRNNIREIWIMTCVPREYFSANAQLRTLQRKQTSQIRYWVDLKHKQDFGGTDLIFTSNNLSQSAQPMGPTHGPSPRVHSPLVHPKGPSLLFQYAIRNSWKLMLAC